MSHMTQISTIRYFALGLGFRMTNTLGLTWVMCFICVLVQNTHNKHHILCPHGYYHVLQLGSPRFDSQPETSYLDWASLWFSSVLQA